jgi:lipopolysaccharide assembly protein A
MTSLPEPDGTATGTLPPPSVDGQAPAKQPSPESTSRHTRISGIRNGLIAGAAGLVVVMIFIIQNTHAVEISFFGAHLHLSLAVALFLAAIAGALLMAAAGTARITQLRWTMRRAKKKSAAS